MRLSVPRRAFLQSLAILMAGSCLPGSGRANAFAARTGTIMTVRGPVQPEALGFCLPHEHLLSRFGAPPAEPANYDAAAALEAVVPYLKYLSELGVTAVADCTAYSFGRAPTLLRRLAEASDLHLITNTGYYGAADDRYVPQQAYRLDAGAIAARWIAEFTDGIGGSGFVRDS